LRDAKSTKSQMIGCNETGRNLLAVWYFGTHRYSDSDLEELVL